MTHDNSQDHSNHKPGDEQPNADIPEAPDVPDGGIPDLNDDQDKPSSEQAREEQDRQLESGEENPG